MSCTRLNKKKTKNQNTFCVVSKAVGCNGLRHGFHGKHRLISLTRFLGRDPFTCALVFLSIWEHKIFPYVTMKSRQTTRQRLHLHRKKDTCKFRRYARGRLWRNLRGRILKAQFRRRTFHEPNLIP